MVVGINSGVGESLEIYGQGCFSLCISYALCLNSVGPGAKGSISTDNVIPEPVVRLRIMRYDGDDNIILFKMKRLGICPGFNCSGDVRWVIWVRSFGFETFSIVPISIWVRSVRSFVINGFYLESAAFI